MKDLSLKTLCILCLLSSCDSGDDTIMLPDSNLSSPENNGEGDKNELNSRQIVLGDSGSDGDSSGQTAVPFRAYKIEAALVPGSVSISLDYPAFVENHYGSVVIRRKSGGEPPNANCDDSNDTVVSEIQDFTENTVFQDEGLNGELTYSYRICVFDTDDTLSFSEVVQNIKPYVPKAHCQAVKVWRPEAASGKYLIDPDGPEGPNAPFEAECDMETDGGGWTLVLNYVHSGGTNPERLVKATALPLIKSSNLGDNEAADSQAWGHAAPSLVNSLQFDESRWFCRTSGHERIVDFKSSSTAIKAYITTGSGNLFVGLNTQFTALESHSGLMPASVNSGFSAQGDNAMTEFPFYRGAANHWGIRGQNGRWECDDYVGNASRNTIHRVWVR